MTENELRNGITAIEVVKSLCLYYKQSHIIIKDINNNEIDSYWYCPDCVHTERKSDNYKVLTVSITRQVSIISFVRDPQIVLTVSNN